MLFLKPTVSMCFTMARISFCDSSVYNTASTTCPTAIYSKRAEHRHSPTVTDSLCLKCTVIIKACTVCAHYGLNGNGRAKQFVAFRLTLMALLVGNIQ